MKTKAHEISKGLNPTAPNLADAVKDWTPRQLFWIVGVKMAAMPSFGATHTDEEVWGIVAFIEKLPRTSPGQYAHRPINNRYVVHWRREMGSDGAMDRLGPLIRWLFRLCLQKQMPASFAAN